MTKEEILKYLNYQGKYTKEIKRKLNKLLKKYHPDVNKTDKKTILNLYQIKKELEDGKVTNFKIEYEKEANKSKNNIKDFSNYSEKIQKLSVKLINKRNKLIDNIEQLYKKINNYYKKLNNTQEKLINIEEEIYDNNQYLNIIFKEIILFLIINMLIIILLFVLNINYYILISLVLLFIFITYFYLKIKKYKEKNNNINKNEQDKIELKENLKNIKNNISVLEKEIAKVRREISEVNGEIHFYGIHLNNYKYKDFDKEYDNNYNRKR